jgi:hypothetical protein
VFLHYHISDVNARARAEAFLSSNLWSQSVTVQTTGASQYTKGVVFSLLQLPTGKG